LTNPHTVEEFEAIKLLPVTTGYCERHDISLHSFGNQITCGGPNRNIGYVYTISFSLTKPTHIAWRFGMDFGYGGVAKLDDVVMRHTNVDMWWGGNWNAYP